MLDTKGTFDDLVHRYARTPEQAEGILANRLYQNLAGALSGTQEYMAMEKLYELVESGEFDVVVVDTPPTRNALDLLDAPRRLTRFLENRLFRALLLPTRMSLRAVGVATQALLRTISKVAGAEIVQDAVGFFQAFEGMEEGFRTRAGAVRELLADPSHRLRAGHLGPARRHRRGQLLRREADRSATWPPAALVVNRIHPHFGDGRRDAHRPPGPLAALEANLATLKPWPHARRAPTPALAAQVAPAPVGPDPALRPGRARAGRPAARRRPSSSPERSQRRATAPGSAVR